MKKVPETEEKFKNNLSPGICKQGEPQNFIPATPLPQMLGRGVEF